MYTQNLLATALLSATFATADQVDNVLSKLGKDAKSLALQNTAAANAVYSWQATQTAVPQNDIDEQNDDYFDAFLTATATGPPAYITALPTSLQSYASSLLVAEASLVMTEVAPIMSSEEAAASASGSGYILGGTGTGSVNANSANSTSTIAHVATIATSGLPKNSANVTKATTTHGPTTSPSPPKAQSSSGAGKNNVFVAAGVVVMGLAGIMSSL